MEQTMIEVFGWGGSGDRIVQLESDIKKILEEYDRKYPHDSGDELRAMVADAKKNGVDYPVRPGSGEKVLVGREHDLFFLASLMALRKKGYADERLKRYQDGVCERIRYYNYTFDGEPEVVLDVMDNRLERYGRDTGQIPVM
ncbi:MAG: hypothetical protein IJ381_08410 [Clostridia bacterium]|nr:hypothetical protein [Clostridia bacterium]MBQ7982633.1 hypothetical protein [Clostridia bacterium]